jgi:hypothetical protein
MQRRNRHLENTDQTWALQWGSQEIGQEDTGQATILSMVAVEFVILGVEQYW